jgi:hypothetical protein
MAYVLSERVRIVYCSFYGNDAKLRGTSLANECVTLGDNLAP